VSVEQFELFYVAQERARVRRAARLRRAAAGLVIAGYAAVLAGFVAMLAGRGLI
jgi:hypothetical protein